MTLLGPGGLWPEQFLAGIAHTLTASAADQSVDVATAGISLGSAVLWAVIAAAVGGKLLRGLYARLPGV